jgi:hypothetical protein
MPDGIDGGGSGSDAPVEVLVASVVPTLSTFSTWSVFLSNQVVETVVVLP